MSEDEASQKRPSSSQALRPHQRVRRSADYLRSYRKGQRLYGSFSTVYFRRNGLTEARVGITASRKVGNSVVRHRIKRRIREIFRRWPNRPDLSGFDLVVHVKPAAAASEFRSLERELGRLMSLLLRKAAQA